MSVVRIRGMRDLEAREVRRLPERIEAAQRHAQIGDEELCRLMGWRLTDLQEVRSGERVPTPAEMRALYGVFGKSRRGTLQTRWLNGAAPPRKAADWVILGDQAEITELDRLRVENRQLQGRIMQLEAELEPYRQMEDALRALTRRLARRAR